MTLWFLHPIHVTYFQDLWIKIHWKYRNAVSIAERLTGDHYHNLHRNILVVCSKLVNCWILAYAITAFLCCRFFYSWTYKVDKLVYHVPPKLNTTYYRVNGLWQLVDTAAEYRVEDEFATARFIVYISRKPHYFLITLVSPCVLLSSLMCLVFLLPPESGEKITFHITVVLSFTFFQVTLAEQMPQTSDFYPIFGKRSRSVVLFILRLKQNTAKHVPRLLQFDF